jgi:hypothetical protein
MPTNYLIIQSVEETETGSTEPVSVSQLKAFLEISGTDYDTVLADLGEAARKQVEQYTGISMIEKDIVMYCETTPDDYFELRGGVYDADLTIEDPDGNAITDFEQLGVKFKSIKYNSATPIIISYSVSAFAVENLKLAIKILVALTFETRTGFLVATENLNKTGTDWKFYAKQHRRPHMVL